jgi:hypothetical protein
VKPISALGAMLIAALLAGPAAAAEVTLLGPALLRPGTATALRFAITDTATGAGLQGLHPRAWLRAPLRPGESCDAVTGRLARYGAGPRQALSMDGFRLLVPALDGTLATVDPRLDLATANLVRIDRLGTVPPLALLLDAARGLLWMARAQPPGLARLDLATGTDLGPTALTGVPGSLVALPGGEGAVAVGLDDLGMVARVSADGTAQATASVGWGQVLLAAGAERLVALATGDGALAVLDPWTLLPLARLALGTPVAALALVENQDLALAAAGQELLVVDLGRAGGAAQAVVMARVPLGVAADRLAISPDGRWALALDRDRSVLAVVDFARGMRLVHALAFAEGAEELLVAVDTLYVRLREAPAVAILPLGSLETPAPVVERILMGATPTGAAGLTLLVPGEGGTGFWLAHPGDRAAYLFTGGQMRAAATSVPLKAGTAAGLLLQPLAPQPLGGGVYAATIAAPRTPGSYLLAVALDQPAVARCLKVAVATGPAPAAATDLVAPPRLVAQLDGAAVAGRDTLVRLSAQDAPMLAGRTVPVRAFAEAGGAWQLRATALPAEEGGWAVRLRFPAPGRYIVLAELRELGLRQVDGPRLLLDVAAREESP